MADKTTPERHQAIQGPIQGPIKGIVAWFANNGVAANLIMSIIIVGGLMTLPGIKKEIFPEYSADIVTVTVEYRGAAPEEVEDGVCIRIEEAIQAVDGIKRIKSSAKENVGSVIIEALPGYDTRKLLDDVKSKVDAIDTFPEETERPVVRELTNRFQVINVSISGETDEFTLKRLGERVRDEILLLPGITQAELKNARPYEISIELSEDSLRRHGLTFDYVSRAVQRASLDLPGGSLKTEGGEILLRTKGQAYRGQEFESLALRTRPDGTKLRVGDVARVRDAFEEVDQWARLDGRPAVLVQVFRVGDQSALDVSATVHEYVAEAARRMPEGITLTTWQDNAEYLRGRMDLLLRNGRNGLILVFVVLALFLRLRLAFWVTIGIPISFLGTIALMPVLGVSVSMISLFSFILVLGIVVDDAIVVGENIFAKQQTMPDRRRAAILGTKEVAIPVIFGVLTTVAAFSPMLFVPGYFGRIFRVIPCIVIPTLLFSLVESKLVLPSHLSHGRGTRKKSARPNLIVRVWEGFFNFFSGGLDWFIRRIYRPSLEIALEWRYLTVAAALATLFLTVGMVAGGKIKLAFFPKVEGDYLVGAIEMPLETPIEVTEKAVRQIEASALKLRREIEKETGRPVFRHILTAVGEQPFRTIQSRNSGNLSSSFIAPHIGEVDIELVSSEDRSVTGIELANRWRELAGSIPGAVELKFTSDLMSSGDAIDIQLSGVDTEQLRALAAEIKTKLVEYPGVFDITDSFRGGKPEIKLSITSRAEALGLSLQDLARQVRQGFYGEQAQRIQRGRDDIRVMVRYPESARRSLGDLETMRVRTPSGAEVPFSSVAEAQSGRGFASITRVDRRRTINVQADVDEAVANANEIIAELQSGYLPGLMAENPGVAYTFEGQQKEQRESMTGLADGFTIALLVIYALMAVPFRSYIQPLIVMSAVPFGIVGAVWGHVIMGIDMSILSLCGMVALTGVVVNDSLVLVSYINSHRRDGMPLLQAVRGAGLVRFRPILLTSLTTAAGITPLMLEKSVQAQFLIPMAVALAFGVLFATVISLVLVPASYLIIEDIQWPFRWLYGREPDSAVGIFETAQGAQPAVTPGSIGASQPVDDVGATVSADGGADGREGFENEPTEPLSRRRE